MVVVEVEVRGDSQVVGAESIVEEAEPTKAGSAGIVAVAVAVPVPVAAEPGLGMVDVGHQIAELAEGSRDHVAKVFGDFVAAGAGAVEEHLEQEVWPPVKEEELHAAVEEPVAAELLSVWANSLVIGCLL